ncbi:MAG: hypothetical protein K0U16_07485 [Gammaproteobacteria bacterium]|nr:hypothetical protein [Gammaproteobacteria bacterium]
MARRRKNIPTTAWYVVGTVGAVALVGTATYLIVRRRRAPQRSEVCPPDGDWVGGRLTQWPHADIFLDASGFGEGLESFGYDVGDWSDPEWNVCNIKMQDAVLQFARDYNRVSKIMDGPPVERIPNFGLITEPTIIAMEHVHRLQSEAGYDWPLLVEQVREARGE